MKPMKETKKREEDLVVGYTNNGPHGLVYDPIILRLALFGAAIGAITLGFVGYMVAEGRWPIVDLGQFSAVFPGTAMVTAAGVGVAIGGLIGALIGLHHMIKKSDNSQVL